MKHEKINLILLVKPDASNYCVLSLRKLNFIIIIIYCTKHALNMHRARTKYTIGIWPWVIQQEELGGDRRDIEENTSFATALSVAWGISCTLSFRLGMLPS